MASSAVSSQHSTAPHSKPGSWSSLNSRQLIKNYDKSPLTSPKHTPPHTPNLSRNSSSASINTTRSEPAWNHSRQNSEASVTSTKPRKDSTASQTSTASQKKSGFMGGLFHKATKEEKEKKSKETEKIILGSRHAAAVKTKMALDPAYREYQEKHKKPSVTPVDPAYLEFQKKHKKPNVKTAGIGDQTLSAHSSAAQQEARFPHSGPPTLHGTLDLPGLTRIDSHDETDTDEDESERTRREWNTAAEHNMSDIPEIRSRQASALSSPWASPLQSRDSSPNRMGARPGIGSKRSSYAAYQKDATGRWTKKTSPGGSTYIYPQQHGGVNADLLAASLAERLDKAA